MNNPIPLIKALAKPDQAMVTGAVNDWLDDHPEATTTVEDASLTLAKFSPALKRQTIKDYVTPEMYGAVGDGTTDDSVAMQAAINSDKPVMLISDYAIQNVVLKSHTKIFGTYRTEIVTTEGQAGFIYSNTVERCYFDGFAIRGAGIGFKYVRAEEDTNIMRYLSNSVFSNLSFFANLQIGVEANLILCQFINCIFGYYGTPNPNGHSHVVVESTEAQGMSTFNMFYGCRFYFATEVSVKLENSLLNYFVYCNFEQNNCAGPTIHGIANFKLVFDKCWFEENTGGTVIYMESGSVYPARSVILRDCYVSSMNETYDYLVQCTNGKEYVEGCVIYCNNKPINSANKEFGSFYNNVLYNAPVTYSDKLPISQLTVASAGFVEDRWFQEYSGTGNPDGWTVTRMTLTAGDSAFKGTGLHYKGSVNGQNAMLYRIAMPGLSGKALKIIYVANRTSGTDDALRPCLSTNEGGASPASIPGSTPVTGSTRKTYEKTFTAPADEFYVGLAMGGCDTEGNVYAIDVMYNGNTLINPTIA